MMSRVSYSASVDVAAPPERVYEHVADLARHGEWSADPLEITPDGEDAFRSIATSKGKTITATLRVTERAAPRLFAFTASDLTGTWSHRFTLAPASGGGTKVTREITGELGGAQLALFWLVLLPIKRPNARRALAKLKQRVES